MRTTLSSRRGERRCLRPALLLCALWGLGGSLLCSGCAEDMTTAYTIETVQDAAGENHLMYRTECGAIDPSSSFTVTFALTGPLDGQWPHLNINEKFVGVTIETADGPALNGEVVKIGKPGERPMEIWGLGGGTRTDANGTVWNTWEGMAAAMRLNLLVGGDYVDAKLGDIEFTMADAKVRGMADFVRRMDAQ